MTDLTDTERAAMDDVLDRACALHAQDGDGPVFTAAIVRDGQILAQAKNEVAETGDPTRHAEVVAIGAAAAAAGGRDLSGATLLASCQPCEMCLAAMRWAGIDRVIYAAQKPHIEDEFFRFPGLDLSDFLSATPAEITAIGGIGEDRVLHIYGKDRA